MSPKARSPKARTTVSIPADLKAWMEAEGDSVNWSAVAEQAFRLKLAEISSQKESITMREGIERLKALKQQEENEMYQDGFQTGQQWALRGATPRQLRRLQDSLVGNRAALAAQAAGRARFTYTPAENLFFVLEPDHDHDRQASAEFWQTAVGQEDEKLGEGDWVRGFADGALEVWNQV